MTAVEGNSSVHYEWLVYNADQPALPMIGTGYHDRADNAKQDATEVLKDHPDAIAMVKAIPRGYTAYDGDPHWNGETSMIGYYVRGGVKWMPGTKLINVINLLRVRRALRQL